MTKQQKRKYLPVLNDGKLDASIEVTEELLADTVMNSHHSLHDEDMGNHSRVCVLKRWED